MMASSSHGLEAFWDQRTRPGACSVCQRRGQPETDRHYSLSSRRTPCSITHGRIMWGHFPPMKRPRRLHQLLNRDGQRPRDDRHPSSQGACRRAFQRVSGYTPKQPLGHRADGRSAWRTSNTRNKNQADHGRCREVELPSGASGASWPASDG